MSYEAGFQHGLANGNILENPFRPYSPDACRWVDGVIDGWRAGDHIA